MVGKLKSLGLIKNFGVSIYTDEEFNIALFNEDIAKLIHNEYGQAKIVMANNCIAHVNDLNNFMYGVDKLLEKNGVFIFETGYWGNMIKRANYEQIYHDHYCYFSIEVWRNYLKKFEMKIFDAVVTPAQDNCAIRVFICRDDRKETGRLKEIIADEEENGINTHGHHYWCDSSDTVWLNVTATAWVAQTV